MNMLPGGPLEIVFSFDTTRSMYRCLEEVRGRLQDLIQRLQADIPGIRVAVFAHGDYCSPELHGGYVTKHIDFSTNVADLCEFVQKVEKTSGGDWDECYELVLREVRQKLGWSAATSKVLVMMGDATPHEPFYELNTQRIDWRKEADLLGAMGVKIHGVQCRKIKPEATQFYKTISEKTGGNHIELKDFSNIFDLMMAVCYREQGAEQLQAYEKEVRERHTSQEVDKDMGGVFASLMECSSSPISSESNPSPEVLSCEKPGTSQKKPESLPSKPNMNKRGSKLIPTPTKKKIKRLTTKTDKSVMVVKKRRTASILSKKASLLRRENVPDTQFVLSDRVWSPWTLAMATELHTHRKSSWKKRRYGCGFKVRKLFNETNRLSLYEVAVQCRKHEKKCVVCFRLSKFDCRLPNWETRLFGRKDIKCEINNLMKKGCKIFVRRLPLRRKQSELNVMKALKKI